MTPFHWVQQGTKDLGTNGQNRMLTGDEEDLSLHSQAIPQMQDVFDVEAIKERLVWQSHVGNRELGGWGPETDDGI